MPTLPGELQPAAYACALLLAAILAWAAAAKLRGPSSVEQSFRSLGLPLPHLLARVVPGVELAVALLLVALPGLGGRVALLLLVGFSLVLLRGLRLGPQATCSCFGASQPKPVTRVFLLRNVMLAVTAVAAIPLTSPVAPGVEDLITASTAFLLGGLLLSLLELRSQLGQIWDNRLAGEPLT